MLHERNAAWSKARKTTLESDWLHFRRLRNLCTVAIRKAKAEHFLSETSQNLNNPLKFWKTIKSLAGTTNESELPSCIVMGSHKIYDKANMVDCFNEHFISSGSLFDSVNAGYIPATSCSTYSSPGVHLTEGETFSFKPVTVSEVHKVLKCLDSRKSGGPDQLNPYFLKLAADFIAEPLTYLFNLSLFTNKIPTIWKSAFVLPLLKGGDPSILNNYRPISKLSTLMKVLETLVSHQLKEFLLKNNCLSNFQSGFRKKHSTVTTALKVVNDFIETLDKNQHCAALFLDLSKAFDTVDHAILLERLVNIGISKQTVLWFKHYLSDRTQCTQVKGVTSSVLNIKNGVPQGSVLGPLLFIIYIDCLCQNAGEANFHFYADDTVIYCSAPTLNQALCQLQLAFNTVQCTLYRLKLLLNADKTKLMTFSKAKLKPVNIPSIITFQGSDIESVSQFKYLGFLIDDSLSFKPHIQQLVKKLKQKLGFYFRNKACFSFEAKKRLVAATFMSVLDYGDVLYMHASAQCLHTLDTVYHGALRFITNFRSRTHHCSLYARVGWSALSTRRLYHWHVLVYKAILGLLPCYLGRYLSQKFTGSHNLRSQDLFLLSVPRVRTELGSRAFSYAAPFAWNELQKILKLRDLVSLVAFKALLKDLEIRTSSCSCFDCC